MVIQYQTHYNMYSTIPKMFLQHVKHTLATTNVTIEYLIEMME